MAFPQTNYGYLSDTPAFAGMLADDGAVTGRQVFAKANSGSMAKQTIGDLTVTKGASAGTFSITVAGTSAGGVSFSETVSYAALAGDTATIVGDGLAAALNANENINDVAIASSNAGVITLEVRFFGVDPITSVSATADGSGNAITASPTVTAHAEAAVIPFGYAVGRYTTDGDDEVQKITSATNLTVVGIAKRIIQYESPYPYSETAVQGYAANATVEVVRRSRIWCPVAAAVTRDTQPYFLNATGQLTANGAGSATALTGATYLTSTTGAGLALVEINLP